MREKRHVLLVEDNDSIRDAMREILSTENISIDTAPEGFTGLRMLKEREYCVVVLDMAMPGLDGCEFLKQKGARGDRTPVIVSSASSQKIEIKDDIVCPIKKPFDIDEFIKLIKGQIDAC
jgi:DNA-binding NtrC family response regulator